MNQTLVFNQLPILSNQQLVYSLPQVQGLNSNTNGQQYYLFIPANENVTGQSVISIPIQKDNESASKADSFESDAKQIKEVIFAFHFHCFNNYIVLG